METQKIKELLAELFNSLGDKEIIEIEAGKRGIAIFPQAGIVACDESLCEGRWNDRSVQQYWTNRYDMGALVRVNGCLDESLYEMAGNYLDDEEITTQLDLKLKDDTWVKNYAEKARAAMIAEINEISEVAHSQCMEILEQMDHDSGEKVN